VKEKGRSKFDTGLLASSRVKLCHSEKKEEKGKTSDKNSWKDTRLLTP